MPAAAATARARVRAELTREILDVARDHLVEHGAHDLSLRAVARSLGMAPSGLYRYFAGRDELLTALIIDSYAALGRAAEEADRAAPVDDHGGRWAVVTDAIWSWAHDHPQEWALLYGSPVPGYRAPTDTVDSATRVIGVVVGIVTDAAAADRLAPAARPVTRAAAMERSIAEVRDFAGGLDDAHIVATLTAWAAMFGLISLHLYGHLVGAVTDADVLWRQVMADQAELIGLRSHHPTPVPRR